MQCTNIAAEPFKTIAASYNTAAADYIASILEDDAYRKWYGSDSLPKMKDFKIVAPHNGEPLDIRKVLSEWKEGERRRQGFDTELPITKEGALLELSSKVSLYNNNFKPFKARLVRRTAEQGEYYTIDLDFNKSYERSSKEEQQQRIADDIEAFSYLHDADSSVYKDGKKGVSLKATAHEEGTYQIGDAFYRVTLRSDVPLSVSEVKDPSFRQQLIVDPEAASETRDFMEGKRKLFVYDIDKLQLTDKEARGLKDFRGVSRVKVNRKAKGAKFLTGYSEIDKYIKALIETKTSLQRQRSVVKGNLAKVQKINNRILVIDGQIEQLKKDKEIPTVLAVGNAVMAQLNRDLQHDLSFTELNEGLRLANTWRELDQIIEFNPDNPDEATKELLKQATDLRSKAQTMFSSYFNAVKEDMLTLMDKKLEKRKGGILPSSTVRGENDRITLMDIDSMGMMFVGKAFSGDAFTQLLDKMLNEAEYKASQDSYQFSIDVGNKVRDLLGKDLHHTKASDFNFMFYKDGMMVTKYDRAFQKQLYINKYKTFKSKEDQKMAVLLGATAQDLKGAMSTKDYYNWEKEHFEYELSEDGRNAYEAYLAQKRLDFTSYDEAGNELFDERAYNKIRDEWDPEVFRKWNAGESKVYNKGAYWFTKKIKDAPLSKEYSSMDAKQRAFYDYFVGEFIKGQHDLMVDHRFGEIDVDRELMDFVINAEGDLKDKIAYLGKNLTKFAEGIAGVRNYESGIVHNPTRALTGKEHIGIEFQPVTQFIPDSNGFTKAHPIEILLQFRRAGDLFKQKRTIEEELNALNDLVQTADKAETLSDGRIKTDIMGKVFTTKASTNIAERIAYNVKVGLTGIRKEKHETETEGTVPGEWKASLGQTVDSINNYTRFKAMALSPLSATGNMVMGTVNNFIYAASGQYFNDKELSQAYWLLKHNFVRATSFGKINSKEAIKIAELISRFNLIGDVTEELYHENDVLAKFYQLQKNGEFMSQGATAIAQMLRQKVELQEGGEKRLYDLFELDSNNKIQFRGDLVKEGSKWKEAETLMNYFEKIRKVNDKIHGDYRNALMAKKDVWGRVLLMFRTWLPMAIKERFGKEYEDAVLGAQKGRYRSAAGFLMQNYKSWNGWADIGKLFAKVLLPGVGRKIKFGTELSEVDHHNMMLFVREMQFILMATLACLALKNASGDDDDPQAQSMFRYLYNQGERAQTELMFFFSPKDMTQLVRDIAPIYTTIREASKVIYRSWNYLEDPDSDPYERGFRKGHSKAGTAWQEFLPLTRSAQKTWSSFEQTFTDSRFQ